MPKESSSFWNVLLEWLKKLIEAIQAQKKSEPHDYVEMGDGLKWATCNIGASKPEEFGEYIAWGESEPYYTSLSPLVWKSGKEDGYDWKCAKYFPGPTKYTPEDGKMILDPIDDAAAVRWGGKWRMPTDDEWERLIDPKNFTWTFTTRGGVEGFTVTSKITGYDGNQIFLPCARCIVYKNRIDHSEGCYWSSSMLKKNEQFPSSEIYAKALRFENGHIVIHQGGRGDGFSIRPVSD